MNDALAQRYGCLHERGADQRGRPPAIGRGFRLQWEPAQKAHVLLYPEGMVKLNGSAGEIMKRCDGERTIAEIIVADLEAGVRRRPASCRRRDADSSRLARGRSAGWRFVE